MIAHLVAAWRRLLVTLTILGVLAATGIAAAPSASAYDGRVPDARPATIAGEITAYFNHSLGRDPSAADLNRYAYSDFIKGNCRWGLQDAAFRIVSSLEAQYKWKGNAQDLAGSFYASLLNRPPDPGGLRAYTQAVQQRGVAWAVAQMMGSVEYRQRFVRLCPNPNETAFTMDWQTSVN